MFCCKALCQGPENIHQAPVWLGLQCSTCCLGPRDTLWWWEPALLSVCVSNGTVLSLWAAFLQWLPHRPALAAPLCAPLPLSHLVPCFQNCCLSGLLAALSLFLYEVPSGGGYEVPVVGTPVSCPHYLVLSGVKTIACHIH